MEGNENGSGKQAWVILCAGCRGNILYKPIEPEDRESPLRCSQVVHCPYCDASYNYSSHDVFKGTPDAKHAKGAGNVIALSASMICAVWFAREPDAKDADMKVHRAVALARKVYMRVRSEFPGLFS